LPKIIAHEKVHIREYHWCDLIMIELLTVIFWFNPFIWFYEHSMRQNHEYLADKGVISMGYSEDQYRALLINQSIGMQVIGLTNSLNFALNKNRFKMMTKKKTSGLRSLKFLLALPVLAAMLFACAEPWYQNQESGENINDEQISESPEIVEITAEIVDEHGNPIPGVSVVIKGTTVGT
jgi:beta-lactamase regulating signal transducer with metallopeptidase domain